MAANGHHEDTFHHVRDFSYFELPFGAKLELPSVLGFQITKFMVLQVVAGVVVLLIFRGLAKRVNSAGPVRGRWWNFWETLALFIRDEVVRPTIGVPHHGHGEHEHHGHGDHAHSGPGDHAHHSVVSGAGDEVGGHAEHVGRSDMESILEADSGGTIAAGHPADRYLPFIWTGFFYILICNLLGAIPWLGSATGEINVTGALALVTFGYVIFCGSQISGTVGFWKSLVPGMELPGVLKILLVPFIWAIEFVGFLIKHGVLAVRLFANIMAGHTVIAAILGFIAVTAGGGLWYIVAPASVFGQVAIGLLELFVAFLQAYVFAFLATLFISAAIHPH
jgi:F-type H+-transporting ATPase subunit a